MDHEATQLPSLATQRPKEGIVAGASPKHEDRHGTGVLADRESDTRQQLGGAAGIHVEEAITINKPGGPRPRRDESGVGRADHQ